MLNPSSSHDPRPDDCPLVPRSGEAPRLDLRGATLAAMELSGTDLASSRAARDDGRTPHVTVMGATRVFGFALATGRTTVLHHDGTGLGRDIQMRGDRLEAVVGGRVGVAVDATLGPMQRDDGGRW